MNRYQELSPSRTAQHDGSSSQRILSPEHDKVGMAGEFSFGEFSGVWPDTELKRAGDCGVDFRLCLVFTVDVKTYRKPFNLLHEAGKTFVDIYVLAGYDEATGTAKLIGWEWGQVLAKAPTRDFGHGVISHFIAADKLRPMSDLTRRFQSKG